MRIRETRVTTNADKGALEHRSTYRDSHRIVAPGQWPKQLNRPLIVSISVATCIALASTVVFRLDPGNSD
jgi:hypothetical protein